MNRRCKFCPSIATHGPYCARHVNREQYVALGPPKTGKPKNRKRSLYDPEWRRVSRAWLMANPFCVACMLSGRQTIADIVDHIQPLKSRPDLMYDQSNFQSLCSKRPYSCHQRKTGYERRGIILDFRNRKRMALK